MEKNTKSPNGNTINGQQADLLRQLGLSSDDLEQIRQHGIELAEVERELRIFRTGIPKSMLHRAATIGDGILKLDREEFEALARFFDQNKQSCKLQKFVPASGAASRMFKFLATFLNEFDLTNDTINAFINRRKLNELSIFLAGKDKFPFFPQLAARFKLGKSGELRESDSNYYEFIRLLLDPDELNYSKKPKGVLPFHKYGDHYATPVEEHLSEGARYASSNGVSHLHFTVSEEHLEEFQRVTEAAKPKIEQDSGVKLHVDFSFQDKATDTIAVTPDDRPFRDEEGKLVFRPGGHGALIHNLNALDSDLVFIKNIDNVIQNHIETITLYKKALAGILLQKQRSIFGYLDRIDSGSVDAAQLQEMTDFLKNSLNITLFSDFELFSPENKIGYIKKKLNRPLRVCGMVKNEGEPGGGPFWVLGQQGNISLQIVETSQIELQNPLQVAIVEQSTHFNPVDIVCGLKNYKGEKFNLLDYIDHERGFIVNKTKGGKDLKGYELPGLWNGAMAKWNTIFVEVPLVTFNPVKTVNDLLKPAHQPQ